MFVFLFLPLFTFTVYCQSSPPRLVRQLELGIVVSTQAFLSSLVKRLHSLFVIYWKICECLNT